MSEVSDGSGGDDGEKRGERVGATEALSPVGEAFPVQGPTLVADLALQPLESWSAARR